MLSAPVPPQHTASTPVSSSSKLAPRYFVSKALSLLGNSIAAVALPLVLLTTTGSALAAGTLALIEMIPQVLAGIVGGAALDRFNRRAVSIASDVISALCVAALPLVDATVGLSFGWFALFGVLGAIGDVPGMTARDTLLPAVAEKDGADLQRFVGLAQVVDNLVVVAGPAAAALAIQLTGNVGALWITACTSLAAALVTSTLPRAVGAVAPVSGSASSANAESTVAARPSANADLPTHTGLLAQTVASTRDGLHILFRGDPKLCASAVMSLIVVMVMGGYQGLVLPAHFTAVGQGALMGYTLSAMSAGTLAGTLAYTQLCGKLRPRTWYVASVAGMMAGLATMGALASSALIMVGAAVLGFSSGPFSALLGFFVFQTIPEASRGAVLGTQNALSLVAAPLAVFVSSALVSALGVLPASLILVAGWTCFTLFALTARAFRDING